MQKTSRHTAEIRIPLGDQGYRPPFTRVSVETRPPTFGGHGNDVVIDSGHTLVIESVSEASMLEAELNLNELANRIIEGMRP